MIKTVRRQTAYNMATLSANIAETLQKVKHVQTAGDEQGLSGTAVSLRADEKYVQRIVVQGHGAPCPCRRARLPAINRDWW
jgi:hypothetical protein